LEEKYSEMDSQEPRRLKELEEENRSLKHMYAELVLDNKILKDSNFSARGSIELHLPIIGS
jgi:hypothetical protein